jgi:hypothetical protein
VRRACRARCIPDRYQFDPSDHRLLHALEEEEEEASWPACASREPSSSRRTNPLSIHNLLTADQEPRQDHSDFEETEDKDAEGAPPVRAAAALGRLQSPRNLLRMPSYPFASAVLQSAAGLEVLLPVDVGHHGLLLLLLTGTLALLALLLLLLLGILLPSPLQLLLPVWLCGRSMGWSGGAHGGEEEAT